MKPLSKRERRRYLLRCIVTACLLVAFITVTPFATAQGPKPPEEEQKPKPAPPPPPPKPKSGFGDLLNPPPVSEPAKNSPPAAETPRPEDSKVGDDARLEAQIKTLREKLEYQRGLTLTEITPLQNLGRVKEKARDLRVLVDRMHSRIYLPDPSPTGKVTARLTKFQTRWGDLVRPIIDGSMPTEPVTADRWGMYSVAMSRQYCDKKMVMGTVPKSGMPLGGWTWTCLSDLFFHELAGIETGVDRQLDAKRVKVTATLERLMSTAEGRIANAPAELAVHPSPQLLLRELTGLLHQVELEGMRLRIQELEYQKAAGSGTPVFRWLLETSPRVNRPAGGSSRTISVFSGATITAKLGDSSAKVKVTESALPRLAKRLHDVHFRLEKLRLENADPAGQERLDAESERAGVLAKMAQEARPPAPKK